MQTATDLNIQMVVALLPSALLATYQNGSDTAYAYAYDDNGNIASITRGSAAVTYQYNGANELIRENNGFT